MPGKIGITMGDPSGIGPEIVVSTVSQMSPVEKSNILIVGNLKFLIKAAKAMNLELIFRQEASEKSNAISVLHVPSEDEDLIIGGRLSAAGGEAAYRYILRAFEAIKKQEIQGMVTAPISKEALHRAGHHYDGHTGLLAHLTGTKEPYMLLTGGKLNTIHVSTHVSLLGAIQKLNTERIVSTIKAANEHFKMMGIPSPRIAVAAINPHCGEGGIFGREEIEIIAPATLSASQSGINVVGPISGDTVFLRAVNGEFDVVVAQYHDQGHIPTKLLSFEDSVNVSLGMPIIRTSVDHGTALDIAWTGKAKNRNLNAAVEYARKMLTNTDI